MRVLVTGAGGQLGADLARALDGHDALLLDRAGLDVTDGAATEAVIRSASPDAIVHTVAWTDVDGCETDPARARAVNVGGTTNVCSAAGDAFVVVISTDYVFDGELGRPYVEDDATGPVQVYGRTKLEAEVEARHRCEQVAIARTAWLYGRAGARNFVRSILGAIGRGPIEVVEDQVGSPTCTWDLARALVPLLEQRVAGTFHVANTGAVSRYDFARAIVAASGGNPEFVRAVKTAEAPPRPARRPAHAPLEGKAWREAGFAPLQSWDEALARFMREA